MITKIRVTLTVMIINNDKNDKLVSKKIVPCDIFGFGDIATFCPPGVFLGLGVLTHFGLKT